MTNAQEKQPLLQERECRACKGKEELLLGLQHIWEFKYTGTSGKRTKKTGELHKGAV